VKLSWNGFMPPRFVRDVFLEVRKRVVELKAGGGREGWFALNVSGFAGVGEGAGGREKAYSVMQWRRDTLGWVCE
jgi:hypothetical protein